MVLYQIVLSDDAAEDLDFYTARERKTIVSQIRSQLRELPSGETRNRKKLRENPIAGWELRLGRFRVFYEVDDSVLCVTIVAIGHKIHNALFVRGREVEI